MVARYHINVYLRRQGEIPPDSVWYREVPLMLRRVFPGDLLDFTVGQHPGSLMDFARKVVSSSPAAPGGRDASPESQSDDVVPPPGLGIPAPWLLIWSELEQDFTDSFKRRHLAAVREFLRSVVRLENSALQCLQEHDAKHERSVHGDAPRQPDAIETLGVSANERPFVDEHLPGDASKAASSRRETLRDLLEKQSIALPQLVQDRVLNVVDDKTDLDTAAELLDHDDPEVRVGAARYIERFVPQDDWSVAFVAFLQPTDWLVLALENDSTEVRRHVLRAVAKRRRPSAVADHVLSILIQLLQNEFQEIREASLHAIEAYGRDVASGVVTQVP